jgi:hypothetical protein
MVGNFAMSRITYYTKIALKFLVYLFAVIGFVLVVGFFAVKWHWTDVKGVIDLNDRRFLDTASNTASNAGSRIEASSSFVAPELPFSCKLLSLAKYSPRDAKNIITAYRETGSVDLADRMFVSLAMVAATSSPLQQELASCDAATADPVLSAGPSSTSVYAWVNTPDWQVMQVAITKDAPVIDRVAAETGVEPRLIIAQLISEQMRIYNSERALYESAFAPLKILGSETQFSLGVTGVKEVTAEQIEQNLTNSSSVYYPGSAYEHLLDFTTSDPSTERVERITDQHDHYYSYLYTALYLKEVMTQWAHAGFDISQRPEILSTLYNLGFTGSHPNATPHTGGAAITINGQDYTFGSLGYEFYYSGELADIFPFSTAAAK